MLAVLEAGQDPAVVYVTVYVPNALFPNPNVIVPVVEFNINDGDDDVKVPPGVPLIVGVGSVPVWKGCGLQYWLRRLRRASVFRWLHRRQGV